MNEHVQAPWQRARKPHVPYLIAEVGVNHGGDLATAKEYVSQAAACGFHAVKFQSYRADALAAEHSPAYWDLSEEPTTSQRELFSRFDALGPEDYAELAAMSRVLGLDFSSTPFDLEYVGQLAPHVDFFKIASADITNLPLLRRVGASGLPVILSTGAANYSEINRGLHELRRAGATHVCLLHCVLNYPTQARDANLAQLRVLQAMFPDTIIGYSDHVPPQDDAPYALEHVLLAAMLGAQVVEKHFTLDRSLPGNDHYHAADAETMKELHGAFARLAGLAGGVGPKNLDGEQNARLYARRGLYAARDIQSGNKIVADDIIALRPAEGCVPAEHYDQVVSSVAADAVEAGQPITWQAVSGAHVV